MSRRLGDDGTSTVSVPRAAAAPPPAPQHLPRRERAAHAPSGWVARGSRDRAACVPASLRIQEPRPPRPLRPQAPEADAAAHSVSLVNSSQTVRGIRSLHTPGLKHRQRSALPLPPKRKKLFFFWGKPNVSQQLFRFYPST